MAQVNQRNQYNHQNSNIKTMPTVNYDMSSSIQLNGARNPLSDVSPIDDGLTD